MQLRTTFFLTLIFFLSFAFDATAQDPRFSQFYAAPMQINPAMTGLYEGQMRFTLNYRDQWASILGSVPFRTIAASAEYKQHVAGGDYAAFGLNLLEDQAGTARFQQTKANLSASFLKQLSGGGYGGNDQYLVAGAQIGGGQHSLDWGNLWFSRQYDPTIQNVNTALPSGEVLSLNSKLYLDFSAGLLWYAVMGENTNVYAGASMMHINAPVVSFIDGDTQPLYNRIVVHAGGEVMLNNNLSLLPGIAYMNQGPSMEINAGGSFRFTNHDWRELAIRTGLWSRIANRSDNSIHMDALIVSAVLELEQFNLGISYDINTSSLVDASNNRGAFELSFVYITAEKQRSRTRCPKF